MSLIKKIELDSPSIPGSFTAPRGSSLNLAVEPSGRILRNREITIKAGRGGFRANAKGGLRHPAGGRPRKVPEIVAPPITRPRWYVARAMHGQTEAADAEIREAGFEVLTAQLCHPATKGRRTARGALIRGREEFLTPLFVRYVIVQFDLSDPLWRKIPAMESVERIISGGHGTNGGIGIPIAIPDDAVDRLRKMLSPDGILYPPGYRARTDEFDPLPVGAALQISDGVFGDRAAVCAASDGQRVVMLMNLFNRDNVRVSVAQGRVESV